MKPACRNRSVRIGGIMVARTPLMLPSFSSLALKSDLADTVARIRDIVVGPILISAFDLHFGNLIKPGGDEAVFKTPLTFIDSGGYENIQSPRKKQLSVKQHRSVLDAWPQDVLTVAVNYDCSSDEVAEQIEAAASICHGRTLGRALLLKPGRRVAIPEVIKQLSRHAQVLAGVDVVGVTEKEAGETFLDRLQTVAILRQQLDVIGLDDLPIHIFGGLDPIRTPLYFLAGADIFDGLSWLRYGYEAGRAVYMSALASLEYPSIPIVEAEWLVRRSNFIEVTKMQTALLKYLATKIPEDLHQMGSRFLAILDRIALQPLRN
jgi:hypothetical protein